MSIKKAIKTGVFIFLAVCMVFPVSCKKRMPESPLMTDQQQAPDVSGTLGTSADRAPATTAPSTVEENLGSGAGTAGTAAGVAPEVTPAQQAAAAKEVFLAGNVYFDFDDATLSNEAIGLLTDQARWLRNNTEVSITIEGYCDERGTDEYNLALGARRAESVKAFLSKAGIDDDRMMTISYGEERPADPGHNEDAWAKNRRVEFLIR